MSAATPVICGHAILVPSHALYPPGTVDRIATPGAEKSILSPKLEKLAW